MAFQYNNLRRLIFLYWRHSTEDRENSWTKELYEALIYHKKFDIRSVRETEFIFANVNRKTESYLIHKDTIEYYRRHKLRGEPLIILQLMFANADGSREEMFSIDSQHDMLQVVDRIDYWINRFEK
jgi:hypothetical protein